MSQRDRGRLVISPSRGETNIDKKELCLRVYFAIIVQAKPAITVFFLKNIRHLASPFQTQLFNKFNNEKRGRFFTKIVKNLPQNAWREVHFPSLGRKPALASIYFTPWERHEKTPEAAWRLGFSDRHLFRSLKSQGRWFVK